MTATEGTDWTGLLGAHADWTVVQYEDGDHYVCYCGDDLGRWAIQGPPGDDRHCAHLAAVITAQVDVEKAAAWDEGYDMGDPYQRRGNPGEGKQRNPYRAPRSDDAGSEQ